MCDADTDEREQLVAVSQRFLWLNEFEVSVCVCEWISFFNVSIAGRYVVLLVAPLFKAHVHHNMSTPTISDIHGFSLSCESLRMLR